MKKATPQLPASSKMKMPMAAAKPAIKNAIKKTAKAAVVKTMKKGY